MPDLTTPGRDELRRAAEDVIRHYEEADVDDVRQPSTKAYKVARAYLDQADAGAALAQRVIRAARLLGIANSDTEPNAAETQMLVDDILTHCADLADVEWREWRAEDAEPVTEEWARLAGAVQTFESEPLELFWWIPMADKSDRTFVKVTFKLDGSTSMGIRGSTVALNPTRGHVRRLCAALGLTLPPPPARAAAEET